MREPSKAEVAELEDVIRARSLEMREAQLAKEYVVVEETEEDGDNNNAEGTTGAAVAAVEAVVEPEEPQPSTTGSRGAELGGESEYFYSQFELTTRSRKIIQMVRRETGAKALLRRDAFVIHGVL